MPMATDGVTTSARARDASDFGRLHVQPGTDGLTDLLTVNNFVGNKT